MIDDILKEVDYLLKKKSTEDVSAWSLTTALVESEIRGIQSSFTRLIAWA